MIVRSGLNITDCIDQLTNAGFERKQAEDMTKAFTKLVIDNIQNNELANKSDIAGIKTEMMQMEMRLIQTINSNNFKLIGYLAALQGLFLGSLAALQAIFHYFKIWGGV